MQKTPPPTSPGPALEDSNEAAGDCLKLVAALAAAEAELAQLQAEKEEILDALVLRERALNATNSGITVLDVTKPGYPIAFVNQAIEKRSGYSLAELVGRDGLKFIIDAGDRESVGKIEETIAVGGETRLEVQVSRKDGTAYWAGMFVGPVRDSHGRVTHYISVSADITARLEAERKRVELQRQLEHQTRERERMETELKLSQKLESVGRLASGIAHEINTPIQYVSDSAHFLRGAVGDLEKLLDVYYRQFHAATMQCRDEARIAEIKAAEAAADLEFIREEMPRAFDRMLDGVERVTKIVRAMKEFAHPDANEQSPADINHALETTLVVAYNEYKYLAEVALQLGELPPVKCNISELNQVFLNLIVNAAHAIGSAGRATGEGKISLSTVQAGDQVEIAIADNGCGISQQNLDKIYDPFFTTKEVGKGTGQGLAIARSIVVDRHGGTIEANSSVGTGTRFTIRLPVAGRSS